MTEIMAAGETSDPGNPEKCIKQSAVTVEKNVKSPLNQQTEDLFIAGTASPNTGNPDFNLIKSYFSF